MTMTNDERNAVIEECAKAAEQQDRSGREWVHDSLWARILKRAADNVRALKTPTCSSCQENAATEGRVFCQRCHDLLVGRLPPARELLAEVEAELTKLRNRDQTTLEAALYALFKRIRDGLLDAMAAPKESIGVAVRDSRNSTLEEAGRIIERVAAEHRSIAEAWPGNRVGTSGRDAAYNKAIGADSCAWAIRCAVLLEQEKTDVVFAMQNR